MTATVSAPVVRKNRSEKKHLRPDSNVVVIDGDELVRIKQLSTMMSNEEKLRMKAEADEIRLSRQAKAKARKARMLQLEQFRKSQATELSELDMEEMQAREALLSQARRAADEQNDDVKRMNQMVLYAKCVTIRDKQVQQAHDIKKENEQQEKLLDMMMEYERQKVIQRQREIDRHAAAERKAGAKTIINQMKEREKVRLREKELKTQEGIQLLEQAIAREKQLEAEKQKRQKAGQALLAEIVAANQEQMREKARRRQADIEEDQKIATYIANKEMKEQERDQQLAQLNEAKEKEKRKLIEAREKANDHQAEIDALRARRAHEENERKWRAQQAANAEKQAKIQKELAAARELQRMEKERKMIEQAMIEQEQFNKMLHILEEQQSTDGKRDQEERQKRAHYAKVLAEQIADLESRKLDRNKVIDMGQAARRNDMAERAKLEAIKQAKLLELEKEGVPGKYRAELRSFKVLQSHSIKK